MFETPFDPAKSRVSFAAIAFAALSSALLACAQSSNCEDAILGAKATAAASARAKEESRPQPPPPAPAAAPEASGAKMPMPGLIDVDVRRVVVQVAPKAIEATFVSWEAPAVGQPFSYGETSGVSGVKKKTANAAGMTVHRPRFRLRNLASKPIWHLQYVLFGYDAAGKMFQGPLGPEGVDFSLKVGEAKEIALGAVEVIDPPLTPEVEVASVAFADFTAEVYPPPIKARPEAWWRVDVPRPRGGYAAFAP